MENKNINQSLKKKRGNDKSYIIAILGVIALLCFYTGITNFIKYFSTANSGPIIVDDSGITNLINQGNTIITTSMLKYAILSIPFIIMLCVGFIIRKNKDKSKIFICIFLIIIMLISSLINPKTFSLKKKVNNNDWDISVKTVTRKQRGGHKGRKCYVYLSGIKERKLVAADEFKVYISTNDKVYVINDKKNHDTLILSPNHYKYTGKKLTSSTTISSTKINRGHYLFIGIILTLAASFFLLICAHFFKEDTKK